MKTAPRSRFKTSFCGIFIFASLLAGCDTSGFSVVSGSDGISAARSSGGIFDFDWADAITSVLADAYRGEDYSVLLNFKNAPGSVNTSLVSGQLPTGLTLNSFGLISGRIGNANPVGLYNFRVRASLSSGTNAGSTIERSFTLRVSTPFRVLTQNFPAAIVGSPFGAFVSVQGGIPPYTFLVSGLPVSLSMNSSSGQITGTPGAGSENSYTILLSAQDSNGATTSVAQTALNIILPSVQAPTIRTSSLITATLGAPFMQAILVQGGIPPLTFTDVNSSLGTIGLSLDTRYGIISGTPSSSGGPFAVTIRVTDSTGGSATQNYSLAINKPDAPRLLNSLLSPGTVGQPYAAVIAADSKAQPLTYELASGSSALPAGLNLDSSSGLLSGAPTAAGTTQIQIKVTDRFSSSSTQSYSLTINGVAAPDIATHNLTSGVAGTYYLQPLTATGGILPYQWQVSLGTLPPGLSLDPASGIISGTPTAAGQSSVNFTVTDGLNHTSSAESLTLTIANAAGPVVTTDSLPPGTTGQTYFQTLIATGGTGALTFALSPSTPLPNGLTFFGSSGIIQGTPTVSGTSSLSFTATDGQGVTSSARTLTLAVNAPSTPVLITSSLATGTVGTPYTQSLSAINGTGSYNFSAAGSPNPLPSGLSLSSQGVISGIPTVSASGTQITFQVSDGVGSSTRTLSLQIIAPPPPTIATSSLVNGTVGASYAAVISVSSGIPPYTISLASGSLPNGLQINSSGIIYGLPTQIGTSTFSVTATDKISAAAAPVTLSIQVINPDPPAFTLSNLALATVGQSYDQAISSTGGVTPVTTTLTTPTTNTLRSLGLSFSSTTLKLSGTPTSAGAQTLSFRAQDSAGQATTQDFTLQIQPAPTPVIGTNSIPSGFQSIPYSQVIGVTGGAPPYSFSILNGGSVPSGFDASSANSDFKNLGLINFTPTSVGSFSFTVRVTDRLGSYSDKTYTPSITVPAPPMIQNTSLAQAQRGMPYNDGISFVGGIPPFTISTTVGSLPLGLALAASSSSQFGAITGTPLSAATTQTFTIRVTDSLGSYSDKPYTLTINASPISPLAFVNASPSPSPTISILPVMQYTATQRSIAVTGGVPPYTYSLASGSLPAGINLGSTTGALTGTPTSTGTATFTIQVQDQNQPVGTASQPFALKVSPLLYISTSSLVSARVGVAYSANLSATGGNSSYTYTASGLPPGLSISNAGLISGSVTAGTTPGTYAVAVRVTDGDSLTASKTLNLSVVASFSIGTTTLPAAGVNRVYNQSVAVSGGLSPYTFTLTSGSLPTGLSLNSFTGAITGTVAPRTAEVASGATSFTVQAADSSGLTATQALTLAVVIPPTVQDDISNPLRTAGLGIKYNDYVMISGGKGALTYAATGLPTGLSINATSGFITGTPSSAAGTYSVAVTATDSVGLVGTRNKKFTLVSSGQSTFSMDTGVMSPLGGPNGPNRTAMSQMIAADLNNDGITDLLISGTTNNEIVAAIGNGDGTFSSTGYGTTSAKAPGYLATADLDGDGRQDVIINRNADNSFEIVKGDGIWTGAALTRQVVSLTNPQQIAVGDLNGDGKVDWAIPNWTANQVLIYLNCGFNGATVMYGGVSTPCTTGQSIVNYYVTAQTLTLSSPIAAALIDLDGDGKLDLVSTGWTNRNAYFFKGNGDGTFNTTVKTYNSPFVTPNGNWWAGAISPGVNNSFNYDLNSDGNKDVVVELQDGVAVLFGRGANAFSQGPFSGYVQLLSPEIGNQGNNYHALVADINGDACPDIVTIFNAQNQGYGQRGSVQLWYNQKNVQGTCTGIFGNKRYINPGGYSSWVAAGTFYTGSTRPDLTANFWNNYGRLVSWKNDRTAYGYSSFNKVDSLSGPFFYASPPAYDGPMSSAPIVGDLNNDGAPDFIGKSSGVSTVYLGSPSIPGNYQILSQTVGTGDIGPYSQQSRQLALADFDGDGDLDLVSANWNSSNFGSVNIAIGVGDGTFSKSNLLSIDQSGCTVMINGNIYGVGALAVTTGDFNQDGKMDFAVGHGCAPGGSQVARISVFFGKGNGTFNATPTILSPNGNRVDVLTSVDVNQDGKLDLVSLSNQGFLQVYLGVGDGTFGASKTCTTGLGSQTYQNLDVGDLNNDGWLDFVVAASNHINWVVCAGTSSLGNNYVATNGTTFSGPSAWNNFQSARIVDWNNDGKLDVAAVKLYGGGVHYYSNISKSDGSSLIGVATLSTPTRVFGLPNQSGFTSYANPVYADLNGDGLPDMLNACYEGGSTTNTSFGLSLNQSF